MTHPKKILCAAKGVFGLLLAFQSFGQTALETDLAAGSSHPARVGAQVGDQTIRTFRVKVPQQAIDDLRRRLAGTRWPDQETVTDQSQGVQLAKLKELVQYWGTGYDWREAEAKLNALPQFTTTI